MQEYIRGNTSGSYQSHSTGMFVGVTGGEEMRLTSGGNLGIGENNPQNSPYIGSTWLSDLQTQVLTVYI